MTLAVAPPPDTQDLLPGAQFADAYRIVTDAPAISARTAVERMVARPPSWVRQLMAIRNAIMTPFGVRAPAWSTNTSPSTIGIFPVVSETEHRVVAGFNDKHLDFRVIVDVAEYGAGQYVTATTIVRTHNLLGRSYLALIMPFHRLIVQRMLRQTERPGSQ
jgi:hypothetical protein